ncbi:uncharacterized protein LACBIDRAFT_307743 [Laccaria bicolor S238N-H82]|uniref:Predicted protein n=1 Tax=Laccaria bicolor (strain S238N-H82 / ATCC MYA-4686) TaxID=486041 RepID=B0DQV7_LACBS|nr:uncharacterized protein LACBIDRAFT_307743 [Laccaria bicolor S238N-H82]EDR03184.1 predicted protein [Laccaria bicolor S238N-H82]|eukprot:XP_001886325.1 predicted protein [Laccaria bicolor S238N-H82]
MATTQIDLSNLKFRVQLITGECGVREDYTEDFGNEEFDSELDASAPDFSKVGYDSDDEWVDEWEPWLKIYYIEIVTKDKGKKIGRFGLRSVQAVARTVSQYENLPYRLVASERGGSDLEAFGTTLFNEANRGRLREEFLSGPTKGTGVFGEELNYGSFAVISNDAQIAKDDFFIKPEFRGQGIGSWALQELKRHATLHNIDFLFVEPGVTDITYQQRSDVALVNSKHARVKRFFRKAGFRRVGTSSYFGYSLRNDKHPSRRLAIEDDCEPL